MPELKAIFSADAEPFRKELKSAEALAAQSGRNISSSLSGHGGIRAGAMREFLVALREVGRGDFTRLPGSISILIQRLGLLKYILNPLAGVIIAVGAAAYFTIRHFKNLADQNENLISVFSRARKQYTDLVKTIEDQESALIAAAERAADYAAWLQKLGEKNESLVDATEDAIEALKEQFKIEQEIAEGKGQTKAQRLAAEQKMRQEELKLLDAALLKERQLADQDRQNAALLEGQSEKHRQGMTKNTADKEFYTNQIQNAQKAKDQLDEKTKAEMGKLQKMIDDPRDVIIPTPNGGATIPAAQNQANARLQMEALKKTPFSDIEVGGKNVRVSLEELDNIVAQATGHLKNLSAEHVEAEKKQRELNASVSGAKAKADKEVDGVIQLERKKSKLESETALHDKFDAQLSRSARAHVSLGHLTSLQQVGAYTSPAAISMLDVTKKSEGHLKSIRDDMKKLTAKPAGYHAGKVNHGN